MKVVLTCQTISRMSKIQSLTDIKWFNCKGKEGLDV